MIGLGGGISGRAGRPSQAAGPPSPGGGAARHFGRWLLGCASSTSLYSVVVALYLCAVFVGLVAGAAALIWAAPEPGLWQIVVRWVR